MCILLVRNQLEILPPKVLNHSLNILPFAQKSGASVSTVRFVPFGPQQQYLSAWVLRCVHRPNQTLVVGHRARHLNRGYGNTQI
jgi:hypothetical protein